MSCNPLRIVQYSWKCFKMENIKSKILLAQRILDKEHSLINDAEMGKNLEGEEQQTF